MCNFIHSPFERRPLQVLHSGWQNSRPTLLYRFTKQLDVSPIGYGVLSVLLSCIQTLHKKKKRKNIIVYK